MNKYIIEKDKLINNINVIKSMTNSEIIAMIKCNGYGLGLIPFAKVLVENAIRIIAVSEIEEALILKENFQDIDILLLTSYATEDACEKIVLNNIIATVGSFEAADAINKAADKQNIKPKVHIEINTGMGRCGFDYKDADKILDLQKYNFDVCGTFSHFSFSFSKNRKDVLLPLANFRKTVDFLNTNGFNTGVLHICNSTAFLNYKETHLDCVRIGSAFLGRVLSANSKGLEKIGYLESEIIDVNYLRKGENIGYSNTFSTKRDTKTAIIPVGYAHGYMTEKTKDTFRFRDKLRYIADSVKSKSYFVEINGKYAPVLGRIGMFNIICDITDIDAKPGDKVKIQANPIMISDTIIREYR